MMRYTKALILFTSIYLLTACAGGSPDSVVAPVEQRPALNLQASEAPIDLGGVSAMYSQDVRYGDAERNLFDIYLPDCDAPTPLVIYIHGGGFTGGDKSGSHNSQSSAITQFLEACVAFATINYTLLTVPGADGDLEAAAAQGGVLTSLNDAARALQFMRYHYQSLNLDVENVAVYGGSAGAGASLWLGTHDDLADAANSDPVLRESTRVTAVGALATQATYNLLAWEDILLPITQMFADTLGGTDIPTVASAVGAANYLLTFLGVSSVEAIASDDNASYRANIDMLALMDSGDAPIYVHNFETGFGDLLNLFLHHGLHAIAVKERADEVGLHSVAYSEDPVHALDDPSGENLVSFFLRHIN